MKMKPMTIHRRHKHMIVLPMVFIFAFIYFGLGVIIGNDTLFIKLVEELMPFTKYLYPSMIQPFITLYWFTIILLTFSVICLISFTTFENGNGGGKK